MSSNFNMNWDDIRQTDAYKKEWKEFEDVDDSDGWEGFDEPSYIPPSMQEKKQVVNTDISCVELIQKQCAELEATKKVADILAESFEIDCEYADVLAFDILREQYEALTDENIEIIQAALPYNQ